MLATALHSQRNLGKSLVQHISNSSTRYLLAFENLSQQLTSHRPFFNLPSFGNDNNGQFSDTRKRYQETKLFGHPPHKVYNVVAAVEQYADFVPWCVGSTISTTKKNHPSTSNSSSNSSNSNIKDTPPFPPSSTYLEAELEVGFQMFTERYTSKVTLQPDHLIISKVEDSNLFDHLSNKWEFKPGPTPSTTLVQFEVDFAFRSPLYRQVAMVFFEEVVQQMVTAFENRCEDLYGCGMEARREAMAATVSAKIQDTMQDKK